MHRESIVEVDETLNKTLEGKIIYIVLLIKEKYGEKKIKADTIHELVKDTIELVEKTEVKGEEKREIVEKVIKNLIDHLIEDNEDKKLMNDMIEKRVLLNTIDLIILGSKGKLDINNKKIQKKLISYGKDIFPLIVGVGKKLISCLKTKKEKAKEQRNEEAKEEAIVVNTKKLEVKVE